jgi:multiple sugar transport system ATP-binding protein
MNCGEIQQVGSPMEVYDRPETRFVAGFIGSPPMNFVTGSFAANEDKLSFVAAGLKVVFDDQHGRTLAASDAKANAIELGVRPEDIGVARCETDDGVNCGSVSLVEPLGDCKLLHIAIGSKQTAKLVCKVEPRADIAKGDCVRLRFNSENAHLFDTVSGDNLTLDRG